MLTNSLSSIFAVGLPERQRCGNAEPEGSGTYACLTLCEFAQSWMLMVVLLI